MTLLITKVVGWFQDLLIMSVLYFWPLITETRIKFYDTDWTFYKDRALFFLFAAYIFFNVFLQYLKVLEKSYDVQEKKAKLRVAELEEELLKAKLKKELNEG